jgi:hypothetical protein
MPGVHVSRAKGSADGMLPGSQSFTRWGRLKR